MILKMIYLTLRDEVGHAGAQPLHFSCTLLPERTRLKIASAQPCIYTISCFHTITLKQRSTMVDHVYRSNLGYSSSIIFKSIILKQIISREPNCNRLSMTILNYLKRVCSLDQWRLLFLPFDIFPMVPSVSYTYAN